MEASSALKLLVMATIIATALTESRPLGQFIRHYEPLSYDAESLMWHHDRVRRSFVGPREISLQLDAFDRQFDLQLVPERNFFHPDFQLHVNGKPYRNHQLKSYLYRGYDLYDSSVKARGHLVNGVFEGSISTGDETYHIEPADRYIEEPTDFHSIVYRRSDIQLPAIQGSRCGSNGEVHKHMTLLQNSATADEHTESKHRFSRQTRDRSKVRCWLNVIGDYEFYEAVTDSGRSMSFRVQQAAALLSVFIRDTDEIYQTTNFDQDALTVDNIQFGVRRMDIISEPETGFFGNPFIGVEAFLNEHSTNDWSDFCLSYRFTYRDFDGGVLGLAYIAAQPGSNARGGICENIANFGGVLKTLNTGIVTLLNFGSRVPTGVSTITFAHEAGHNFGSEHDPAGVCSDDSGGRYIMFASANDLSRPNNDEFSTCSKEMMDNVIADKGQAPGDEEAGGGCFVDATNMCGNGIVDENEDCDCGTAIDDGSGMCLNDTCCNGRTCNITGGVECSPDQGPCCSSGCMFTSGIMCSEETECAFEQDCDGTAAACPAPDPKMPNGTDDIVCNGGANICDRGLCNGSICLALDGVDCECTAIAQACDVCCSINGTCLSTIRIAEDNTSGLADSLPNGMGQRRQVGFPCASFTGYCDFLFTCMPVDSEGALERLANLLFDSDALDSALEWVEDMWWAVLLIVVGFFVAMFFIVLIVHLLLPRAQPKHMRKRAERRKTIRRSRKELPGKGVELRNY